MNKDSINIIVAIKSSILAAELSLSVVPKGVTQTVNVNIIVRK